MPVSYMTDVLVRNCSLIRVLIFNFSFSFGFKIGFTARTCLNLVVVRQMESLQEEIEGLRKSLAETSEQLSKTKSQLTAKDEDMKLLQADSKRQLVEVYEMKCVGLIEILLHCGVTGICRCGLLKLAWVFSVFFNNLLLNSL